jgi:hypothetical protein
MGSAPDDSKDVILAKQVPEGYCDLITSKVLGIGHEGDGGDRGVKSSFSSSSSSSLLFLITSTPVKTDIESGNLCEF